MIRIIRNTVLSVTSVAVGYASFASVAHAQIAEGAAAPLTTGGFGDMMPSMWRLFGALIVVLALAWSLMWVAKRVLKGRMSGNGASDLRVLDRVYLAPRRSVEVVSVGSRVLVLGVTDHSISMLTELAETDIVEPAAMQPGTAPRVPSVPSDKWRILRRQVTQGLSRLGFSSAAKTQTVTPVAKS